jgi:hypothetical protein
MRKVFLLDHEFPPTEADIAAATNAGAAEVICGIPEALATLGIDSFGYHEIADPGPVVPASVSMRQARLALLGAGLLDTVQAYIDSAPKATQIEWNYATDIWRSRDLVSSIGGSLGLTSDQIDALFIAAAAIP